MTDVDGLALTEEEADALLVVLTKITLEGPGGPVTYPAFESASAKLALIANGEKPTPWFKGGGRFADSPPQWKPNERRAV